MKYLYFRNSNMKDLIVRWYILYRFPLGIALLIGGLVWGFFGYWEWAWIPIVLGIIGILGHILIGPIRLVQKSMEAGNMEEANSYLNSIRWPGLLLPPVKSIFYMLKGNMAMMDKDLNRAEANIRKTIENSGNLSEVDSMAYFQLATIAFQKNDLKESLSNAQKAVQKGLPDKESNASAFLIMSSIYLRRGDYRAGKAYFKKAKDLKPQTAELVNQIKEIEKVISRVPG